MIRHWWAAAGLALCCASPGAAQELPGRVEATIGVVHIGGLGFGSSPATETANAGGRYTLFDTSTSLDAANGGEARFGVRVSRLVQIEAAASYSTATLEATVSNDAENGASVTATEPIKQFIIEGGATVSLPALRIGKRIAPFVSGGAGYLRQLHEGQTLIETGHTWYAGGGARITLRTSRKTMKAIGARVDARALVRSGGVAFDDRARAAAAVSLAAYFRF